MPRPRWNASIRYRIMLPYLVLIVLMVGGTGLAVAAWAGVRASQQYIERGRGIAETLQRSSFPLTEAVLRQLKGLGGVEFALLDDQGRVRTSTLDDFTPEEIPTMPDGWPPASDLSFRRDWSHDGVRYRIALVDRGILAQPLETRRLLVLLHEPTLQAAVREAQRTAALCTVLAAALAVLLAWWLGRALSRPLSAIHRAVRQIGQGQLHPEGLPLHRHDEIGELADGVAQMAGWLERLQREQVQTERLRLIRQVSAGLAHELRNPLTGARMTLQIFIERNRDRDTEPLQIALSELARMERQVRRFLQIARPEPPQLRPVAIAEILDRCLAGLAATIEHQAIDLVVAPEADLPPIQADPEQMGQVMTNLVLNAIEAAGPRGRVRVRSRADETGAVAVTVEDSGPGIPDGDENRLFQPFFTTKPEGVGLGLALSEALVREHGGRIEYNRSEGWTVFRVVLPTAADRALGAMRPGGDGLPDDSEPGLLRSRSPSL